MSVKHLICRQDKLKLKEAESKINKAAIAKVIDYKDCEEKPESRTNPKIESVK